jgi:hypothetical protein
MRPSELMDKIKQLICDKFSGTLTVKFVQGKIIWARVPRDV